MLSDVAMKNGRKLGNGHTQQVPASHAGLHDEDPAATELIHEAGKHADIYTSCPAEQPIIIKDK